MGPDVMKETGRSLLRMFNTVEGGIKGLIRKEKRKSGKQRKWSSWFLVKGQDDIMAGGISG
jgi:hypothetical protein